MKLLQADWTMDQLKLECTARKLCVAKNTNKADRITIMKGYDDSKVAMEVLLENQRLDKRGCGASEINSERRSKHCPYRLVNVLFSEEFFDRFITSGDTLTRAELDDGGQVFWDNVAEAFNTSNDVFDRLVSEDSLFEGIDPHQVAVHSVAKLKSMWKECSSRLAATEGRCKLSGSHAQFWDYCQGDKVAMYVHLWFEQRGSGRNFCASCVYKENEDDESNELQSASGTTERQTNRNAKKNEDRRSSMDSVVDLTNVVIKLVEKEMASMNSELTAQKIAVARLKREKMERDVVVEKLAAVDGILIRQRQTLSMLDMQIHERTMKGMGTSDIVHQHEAVFTVYNRFKESGGTSRPDYGKLRVNISK